jgi:hypothetical protein
MKKAAVPSILVAALVLAVGVIAEAQPTNVPRIGYLSSSDPATESTRAEAIRLALRDFGYINRRWCVSRSISSW